MNLSVGSESPSNPLINASPAPLVQKGNQKPEVINAPLVNFIAKCDNLVTDLSAMNTKKTAYFATAALGVFTGGILTVFCFYKAFKISRKEDKLQEDLAYCRAVIKEAMDPEKPLSEEQRKSLEKIDKKMNYLMTQAFGDQYSYEHVLAKDEGEQRYLRDGLKFQNNPRTQETSLQFDNFAQTVIPQGITQKPYQRAGEPSILLSGKQLIEFKKKMRIS